MNSENMNKISKSDTLKLSLAFFLVFSVFFVVLTNVVISSIFESGVDTASLKVKVKDASTMFPFYITLHDVDVSYLGVHAFSKSIKISGLLPFYVGTIKVNELESQIDLPQLTKSSSSSTTNFLDDNTNKLILGIAVSTVSIGDIFINSKSIDVKDVLRQYSVINSKVTLSDISVTSLKDFDFTLQKSVDTLAIFEKNLNKVFIGITSTVKAENHGVETISISSSVASSNIQQYKDYYTVYNFINQLDITFNFDSGEFLLVEKPSNGPIDYNGKRVLSDDLLKNILLRIDAKDLYNIDKSVFNLYVDVQNEEMLKMNGVYKNSKFNVIGDIKKREFPVNYSFLKLLNTIDDLQIELLTFKTNDEKFKLSIDDSLIVIDSVVTRPEITGDIDLASDLIIKNLTPTVTIKNYKIDYLNLGFYGNVNVDGTMDAKYLSLGVMLNNMKYKTDFEFNGLFIPNVTSNVDVKYKKNVLNINAFMRFSKKRFRGIKDFIDNHKHGMNMKYDLNLKSIFGSLIPEKLEKLSLKGTLHERYDNKKFEVISDVSIKNIPLLDTLYNDRIISTVKGKIDLQQSQIVISDILNRNRGSFFTNENQFSKLILNPTGVKGSGESQISLYSSDIFKKKTHLLLIV